MDIEWLGEIQAGKLGADAVPRLALRRLVALGLVGEEPGRVVLTQRGEEVLTEIFRLKRWGFPRSDGGGHVP